MRLTVMQKNLVGLVLFAGLVYYWGKATTPAPPPAPPPQQQP